MATKEKPQKRTWISSNNIIKNIILKPKLIIGSGVNVWKMKGLQIIIRRCKLAQKGRKTNYNWVAKVIHWELYKRLKFDQSSKSHMHIPESVVENETHTFLWEFEILTDRLISAKRPDLVAINKKENLKDFESIYLLTSVYIYIYIYIYVCVCVCVCKTINCNKNDGISAFKSSQQHENKRKR